MVFNFRKRVSSVGSRLRPVAGKAKSGAKYAIKTGEKEAEYIYEKRKQGKIANEIEEQELGINKSGPRVKIGSTIISPNGQRYTIVGSTKKYYLTKSGLHIPKSKIDLFDVKEPRVSYISRVRGLISTGKRVYKEV